jgi:putative acetyltransferase
MRFENSSNLKFPEEPMNTNLPTYQFPNLPGITFRPESPQDYVAVYEVNQLAFDGRDAESQLVEAIRLIPVFIPDLSIVAEENGRVIGHILFSPITIETKSGSIPALSLAPMAVHPKCQKRGVGSALVRHGLQECARLGQKIVIVLGHPAFYPRFGFSAALAEPLASPWGGGEAWMALELVPGALRGVTGKVVYPLPFENV